MRDIVGDLLAVRNGRPVRELLVAGKKADLVFEREEFGKRQTLFVETKDYDRNLRRDELVAIWADYEPVVKSRSPATLLVVTRCGLTSGAQAYIESHDKLSHQTIWQLENEIFGLTEYVRHLQGLFGAEGLSKYYVPSRASRVRYEGQSRLIDDEAAPLFETLVDWVASEETQPVALLGGYGAGKSSFAKRLISAQADRALSDPLARRPILVRLGDMARASSLAGLLGAQFTHDFPIDGFSVQNFLRLSDRGRLLTVLDGFDEMKHAMTWADFRSQVQALNRLTEGRAKVILLGRPSAFLSTEEHFHVLRGLKAMGDTFRRLPDWPEFIEYELAPFDATERTRFVNGYFGVLGERARSPLPAHLIEARAAEVNRIADKDPGVFGKPVHAKIFTELASDHVVDLTRFADGISRWTLYETFFNALGEREAEKAARKPISEDHRLTFLRSLAFWLWSERAGATAFNADEIPDQLVAKLPRGEAVEPAAIKREYLTGAFLEKKADDIYYFGHRSFAEFLVAEHLSLVPPTEYEHALYSRLVRDGVEIFLRESPHHDRLKSWASTISRAKGSLHLSYLRFLAHVFGGAAGLKAQLDAGSPLDVLLGALGEHIRLDADAAPGLLRALRDQREPVFFSALSLLQVIAAETNKWSPAEFGREIAAAVLDRAFEHAEYEPRPKRAVVDWRGREARGLGSVVLGELKGRGKDKRMSIQADNLTRLQQDYHSRGGVQIVNSDSVAYPFVTDDHVFSWSDVLDSVSPVNRALIADYFEDHRNLVAMIFVGSETIGPAYQHDFRTR